MRPDGRQYGAHGRRLYSTWSLHFRQSYSEIILPCPPTPVKAFPRFALPSHRLYTEITGSYPQLPQSFQQPQSIVLQWIPGFFQNYAGPELVVFYSAKASISPALCLVFPTVLLRRGRGLPGPWLPWPCPGRFGRGKPLPYPCLPHLRMSGDALHKRACIHHFSFIILHCLFLFRPKSGLNRKRLASPKGSQS